MSNTRHKQDGASWRREDGREERRETTLTYHCMPVLEFRKGAVDDVVTVAGAHLNLVQLDRATKEPNQGVTDRQQRQV